MSAQFWRNSGAILAQFWRNSAQFCAILLTRASSSPRRLAVVRTILEVIYAACRFRARARRRRRHRLLPPRHAAAADPRAAAHLDHLTPGTQTATGDVLFEKVKLGAEELEAKAKAAEEAAAKKAAETKQKGGGLAGTDLSKCRFCVGKVLSRSPRRGGDAVHRGDRRRRGRAAAGGVGPRGEGAARGAHRQARRVVGQHQGVELQGPPEPSDAALRDLRRRRHHRARRAAGGVGRRRASSSSPATRRRRCPSSIWARRTRRFGRRCRRISTSGSQVAQWKSGARDVEGAVHGQVDRGGTIEGGRRRVQCKKKIRPTRRGPGVR